MINKIIRYYKKNVWSPEKYARSLGVKIGKECLISTINFPSEPYLIEIGDFCRIASGVTFFTHGGLWSQRKRTGRTFDIFGKIKIGNYTYIGQDAKIMPGVTIEDNVIVGAGSIITKSIPAGKIVAGNPGRIIGDVDDFILKVDELDLGTKGLNYEEKKKFLLSLSNDKFISK
jgi:acetyltransferase-like isoleucine patch superfamily enzyme